MAATNGTTTISPEAAAERAISAMSALTSRIEAAQRLGYAYAGNRDVYEALGWPKTIQLNDLTLRYERQDIAGRVVDLPANATWREGFEITDDETPDTETPFEAAWKDLDRRLRIQATMQRLDRLSGLHEYACMFLGVRSQDPIAPLRRARGPDDLLHLSVFTQPNADVDTLEQDPASPRFGLPLMYGLQVRQRTAAGATGAAAIGGGLLETGPTIRAHHSRIIHAAEGLDETKIYGRPRLLRVYNLLFALELVVGAAAEGFWRSGARARFHANALPEVTGQLTSDELTALGDQVARFTHGMQDWLRTSGMDVTQFQATTGDPRGPAEVILDLIAAASDIPKRILLGSERGELASSQDATEWAHRIDERQRNHVEPTIVRPFVDSLIGAGMLPEPRTGDYEIIWPDLTGPTANQRAELADRIAAAEMKHAQAKVLGVRLVTENELRETLGLEPIDELDDDLSDDEPMEPEPEPTEPGGEGQDAASENDEAQSLAVHYDPDQPRDPAGTQAANPFRPFREFDAVTAMLGDVQVNAITLGSIMRAIGAVRDEPMRSETADRILGAVTDFVRRTAERFGIIEVDPVTAATRDFIRQYGVDRVRGINDTTREALRNELVDGMRAGEGRDAMARRVRKVFADAGKARSLTIAQSEVNRAAGHGTLEGMRQAGVALKTWNTLRDSGVREAHQQMEGQTVPVGDPFTAPGGETAMYPGDFGVASLDVNCRCYPTAAEVPSNLRVAALTGPEYERRRQVHERRVRAGVRRALRTQRDAVLAALEE